MAVQLLTGSAVGRNDGRSYLGPQHDGWRKRHKEEIRNLKTLQVQENNRPLRVLLVEDCEDNRLLMNAYLRNTQYQVDVAENGEVAVRRFVAGQYDLVLMDIQMPVMDGYTATKMIRQWEMEQGVIATPIIALTACARKEDVDNCLAAGCTAHVSKPVKKHALLKAIQEHTRKVAA